MPSGILLLNKPEGIRSSDCVARVKRVFRDKTGHAGTLDSTACGLLVTLVGQATRLSDFIMRLPKLYSATVRLGAETDTADASGEIVSRGDAGGITESEIDSVLKGFAGEIMQAPPEISAIKVGGKPAHRIARSVRNAGTDGAFSLPERPVTVYGIKRTADYSNLEFDIEVRCGKGTYIRSIARDIGRALGCGGHVTRLMRLSVGNFTLEGARGPDGFSPDDLLPPESAAELYDRVMLNGPAEARLLSGLSVALADAGDFVKGEIDCEYAAVIGGGLFGFAEVKDEGGAAWLAPRVNIGRGPDDSGRRVV